MDFLMESFCDISKQAQEEIIFEEKQQFSHTQF